MASIDTNCQPARQNPNCGILDCCFCIVPVRCTNLFAGLSAATCFFFSSRNNLPLADG
jgi:hypothetical protein